ncbi:MAG: carbohydrate kinase [Spirochaetes bacterium]|nr:carbohydrate kinase [Spirochaetota bacterium]
MIICCGEALIDMIPAPVDGRGDGFLPLPGGSPYNTAIAIGRLGVPVKFLGRLSTDFFGELLVKRLRKNRVGDDLIVRCGQKSTLAFVKLQRGREPQYVFYTESSADRSLTAQDLPRKLPGDTNCILFGSISMTMEPVATAIETLISREGAGQGSRAPVVSLDPNIRPFMIANKAAYKKRFEKWVAASTIVKISEADFGFIYPKLEPGKALQKIIGMGARLAINTKGGRGAEALLRRDDGTAIKAAVPGIKVPLADTIGAGDTFHGAFLAWLELKSKMSQAALAGLTEGELCEALFFANKAASIVCSRSGAEPPSRRELKL